MKIESRYLQTKDKEVIELMKMFEFDYMNMRTDLVRMQEHQRIYDNVINEAEWPTNSRLPIPFLFAAVHDSLPTAMDYLFPRRKWVNLLPNDDVPPERTERVEWAVQLMLTHRMRVPWYAYPSIHSCFKVGVGYGAIEPYVAQTPEVVRLRLTNDMGEVTRDVLQMGVGARRISLRYVNIPPGHVIVSKDGATFNGHKRVSRAWWYCVYSEEQIRDLYRYSSEEFGDMKLSADAVIEEARACRWGDVAIENDIARLAGVDEILLRRSGDDRIPVRVPVLKCYMPGRHVWIANGTQIIYDAKDKYHTMVTPLIKWSAWPDGDRFFPPSAIEVAVHPAHGINLWVNLMFDLLVEVAKPVMLYNQSAFGHMVPERGPNGMYKVNGDVRLAAMYLDRPNVDPSLFQMAQMLERWYSHASGHTIGDFAPGYLRSGINAFREAMQAMRGRERLANYVLQMGSIEDLVRLTLAYMQVLGIEGTFVTKEWDYVAGRDRVRRISVTQEDLMSVYDVDLDFGEKMSNELDVMSRLALYNALSQNPYVDQYENVRMLIGDDYMMRRLMPSRERVRQMQEEQRMAQLAAARQGAGMGAPQRTQAEAGAAGLIAPQEPAGPETGGGLPSV